MSMFNKKSLILFIIIIIICLLGGYFIINGVVLEKILSSEVNKIYKVDITSNQYDYKIKTSFTYSVIEKKVKEYIKDQNTSYLEVSNLMNDKKIKSLLSYDNYETDGKDFNESIQYINTKKEKINEKMDELISNSNDNYLINLIKAEGLNTYYNHLCDKILNTDKMVTYLNNNRKLFISEKDRFNNTLDVELEVLNFLKSNKNDWELKDGEIQFRTEQLLNQYNLLISKIK